MKGVMLAALLVCACSGATAAETQPRNQMIEEAEYFLNHDPGEGNGTTILGTFGYAEAEVVADLSVPVGTVVYVRFRSSNGRWSAPQPVEYEWPLPNREAILYRAEYFVDTDPGPGNGKPTNLGTDGSIVIPQIDLSVGQAVYVRCQDSRGRWTPPRSSEYRWPMANGRAVLEYCEYFVNDDPGCGNGTQLSFAPDGSLVIPEIDLSLGDLVCLRCRDSFGRWSEPMARQYRYKEMHSAEYRVKYTNGTTSSPAQMTIQPHVDPTSSVYEAQVTLPTGRGIDSLYLRFRTNMISGLWDGKLFLLTPSTPLLVSPQHEATDQPLTLTLVWSAALRAVDYQLQVARDSAFANIVVGMDSIVDTVQTVGPLLQETMFYWRVRAWNAEGVGGWSEIRDFTTGHPPPARPVLVFPDSGSTDQLTSITLGWSSSAGATEYRLQVADGVSFGTCAVDSAGLSDTTCTVGPLAAETVFFWRVQASNAYGASNWSEVWSFATGRVPVCYVYPGDTNNDGIVDILDVLPLAIHYQRSGPARPSGSLRWGPQPVYDEWDGCYADCDGNGEVESVDIAGIADNWFAVHSVKEPPEVDRVAVCMQLLSTIDRTPSGAARDALRKAVVEYMESRLDVAFEWRLEQNRPNPFRTSTTIQFALPCRVRKAGAFIFDVTGRLIWREQLESLGAGLHCLTWNGRTQLGDPASPGVYFCKVIAGPYSGVMRMVLLR